MLRMRQEECLRSGDRNFRSRGRKMLQLGGEKLPKAWQEDCLRLTDKRTENKARVMSQNNG